MLVRLAPALSNVAAPLLWLAQKFVMTAVASACRPVTPRQPAQAAAFLFQGCPAMQKQTFT